MVVGFDLFVMPAFYDSYGEAWGLYEWAAKAWIFRAGAIPEFAGVTASRCSDRVLLRAMLYGGIAC